MKFFVLVIFSALFSVSLQAQFTKAIEDNSFFIEEAYNQEEGVVQHIFTGARNSGSVSSEANFTQEWPVFGQAHQLSYTIPYLYAPTVNGIGDFLLNYRYQLINENGLAVSPRFSLIIPTGNDTEGLGSGVVGVQLNFPVSKRWNNEFISHFNAGLTMLPGVKIGTTAETLTTYFAGASGIYLANRNFNVMTEIVYSAENGSDKFILSPGLRYAIDIGDLQLVPGLALPFYITTTGHNNGIVLYLSLEHFF